MIVLAKLLTYTLVRQSSAMSIQLLSGCAIIRQTIYDRIDVHILPFNRPTILDESFQLNNENDADSFQT